MGTSSKTQIIRLFSALYRIGVYEPPEDHRQFKNYVRWIKSIAQIGNRYRISQEDKELSKTHKDTTKFLDAEREIHKRIILSNRSK